MSLLTTIAIAVPAGGYLVFAECNYSQISEMYVSTGIALWNTQHFVNFGAGFVEYLGSGRIELQIKGIGTIPPQALRLKAVKLK